MNLKPWQERLVLEKQELDAKLAKLEAFLGTPNFEALHPTDRSLLRTQFQVMKTYSVILEHRVARFQPAE